MRSRNVSAAKGAFVGVILHVEALAGKLKRRTYVDKFSPSLDVFENLVAEGLPLGSLWYSDYLDARQEDAL